MSDASLINDRPRTIYPRRHDHTGRSTTPKRSRRINTGPPKDMPWVWHTAELRRSEAWRTMGLHTRKLLEFLELEHMAHAGTENGRLLAPYKQLVKWGIGRQYIAAAIADAERRGLLGVERGGRKGTVAMHEASRYRLTYLHARTELGGWQGPTDDWRRFRVE